MPFVYKDVGTLEGKDKVGDGECVTLIKTFTDAGWTGRWKQGAAVVGNKNIVRGTAVANFVDGKWPGRNHGNHLAFYMGQVSDGIYILDQWPDKNKIGKRFIRSKGKDARGNFINPTDNADAFFIIE
ncbi:BPSL0067 family protein [Rugamonas sp. FT82W]|uniref:BPSL0067 family protein n=1 Tax=Duganella vulcania TaxID=2692166 RepID=A0A845G782_9BURK|nr:BPSL0067 family protein [Duganella vulcania]MYM88598.1 BPSL0067 family protein [Duganella vulcania]